MICILAFLDPALAGLLHRLRDRRVTRRLGPPHLRRIFTKIATSRGPDEIVFNLPRTIRATRVIADCTGDNAGDSVGPRGWF